MTDTLPPGPYRSLETPEGVKVPWYILPFDERGTCTAPLTRKDCLERVETDRPTNVFLFCHGWNNDWKYATKDRYEKFIKGYEQLRSDKALSYPKGYKALLIGAFWPSTALLFPHERGPRMAAQATATVSPEDDEAIGVERQEIAEAAKAVPQKQLPKFYELTQLGVDWNEESARDLAALLLAGYQGEEDAPRPAMPPPKVDDLIGSWRSVEKDLRAKPGRGHATVVRSTEIRGPNAAPFLGIPTPREIIRMFTVWRMKDRAKVVGDKGVGPLLRDLLDVRAEVRIHMIGHSYGCQVVLAGICSGAMRRQPQIDSALLLQGAVSAKCFAQNVGDTGASGAYRPAFKRVRQPILATNSRGDNALFKHYHLTVDRYQDAGERRPAGVKPYYAALGGYGPSDCNDESVVQELLAPEEAYPQFASRIRIVGLDGTNKIMDHGDICKPEAYWALYNQVLDCLVEAQ